MCTPLGTIQAAATTGPASGPRPASSTPATRVDPLAHQRASYDRAFTSFPARASARSAAVSGAVIGSGFGGTRAR